MSDTDDTIARFRAATEANDINTVMDTLAPEVDLVSPISGHMVFRGKEDLRVLLTAVYGAIHHLHWHDEIISRHDVCVLTGEATVSCIRLTDATVLQLTPRRADMPDQAAPSPLGSPSRCWRCDPCPRSHGTLALRGARSAPREPKSRPPIIALVPVRSALSQELPLRHTTASVEVVVAAAAAGIGVGIGLASAHATLAG